MENDEKYVAVVGEIFDGYTECDFDGRSVYLKHFSIRDQRHIHRFYEKYKNIAIRKGVPTERQMLDSLKRDELWSDEEDAKLASLATEIDNLRQTKKNLPLPSQRKQYDEQIQEREQELARLQKTRAEIVGTTAEDYANSRAHQEFLRYIVYSDKDCSKHLFSEESFGELADDQLKIFGLFHRELNERLNERVIQEAVLRDFFSIYLGQSEDLASFFGRPIIDLSSYQLKLGTYARVFNNIFQYHDEIPDNIRKDPSAILAFVDAKKSSSKMPKGKSQNTDNGATAVFGATKEDLGFVDPSAKPISLSDMIAKKGGSLNMEDMMKIMGD